MKLLRDIIEDSTGGASTARFNAVVCNVVACFVWGFAAIVACIVAIVTKAKIDLPDLPYGVAGYCLAMAGLKVYQRVNGETNEPKRNENPQATHSDHASN